jgi:hypothetical protein
MVGFNWYISFLASIESRNFQRVAANLADQCTLLINSSEMNRDKANIIVALESFWRCFGRFDHELLNILGNDHSFSCELLIHCCVGTAKIDGLRSVWIIDRNENGQVTSLRLCGDYSKINSFIFAVAE